MTGAFRDLGMPRVRMGKPRHFYEQASSAADFRRWLKREGKGVYVRYLLTHPAYLLGAPLKASQPMLDGKPRAYSKHPVWTPAVVNALFRRGAFRIQAAALCVALVVALSTRARRHPLVLVAAGAAILVVPHAIVVWHGDAIELSRHGLMVWLQMVLALVLAVVGIADSLEARRTARMLADKIRRNRR
jgi:hypothetical protein